MVDIKTLVNSFSLDELKEIKELTEKKLDHEEKVWYVQTLAEKFGDYKNYESENRGDFRDVAELATLWASNTVGVDWSKWELEQYCRYIIHALTQISREFKETRGLKRAAVTKGFVMEKEKFSHKLMEVSWEDVTARDKEFLSKD